MFGVFSLIWCTLSRENTEKKNMPWFFDFFCSVKVFIFLVVTSEDTKAIYEICQKVKM